MMANLGMADTLILMVLALVVFGPRRLPQIGRQIGKLMYEFRKASNDFKFQMEEELRQSEEADRRQKEDTERQKALVASQRAPRLDQPAESAEESAVPAMPETPIESPHPEESSYLDLGAEGTPTEESTAASVESSRPEDEGRRPEDLTASPVEAAPMRIQPPSTGEVVAANPPGRPAQQAELFESNGEPAPESAAPPTGDAATAPESTTPDAANGGPNGANRSEPAAHHG